MSIHVILGKPGSGKSMYATKMVERQLIETPRNIVTNLPLRLANFNEYLQKKYPTLNLEAVTRIRLLTDDEIKEFWRFRTLDGKNDAGDYSGAPRGVAYFLDEAHIAFNARDWATIGRGALHYLSQHRKLGDIVFPITQSAGNLDKQFRSVSEDFSVLRNEYTAKYGWFKGRGRFVRKTYLQEPQQNAEPFDTSTFTLDVKGIASCYDTAKGIGVHGSTADIGRRAKGIPAWVLIPAFMVLALACVALPWVVGHSTGAYLSGDKSAAQKEIAKAKAAMGIKIDGQNTVARKVEAPIPPVTRPTAPSAEARDTLFMTGCAISGKRIRVTLSNGRIITEEDGLIAVVRPNGCRLTTGQWIPIARRVPGEYSQAPAVSRPMAAAMTLHADSRSPATQAQSVPPVATDLKASPVKPGS